MLQTELEVSMVLVPVFWSAGVYDRAVQTLSHACFKAALDFTGLR